MALPGGLKTNADNAFVAFRDTSNLQSKQSTYFTANNRYWQGISSPTPSPADGASPARNFSLKPTDQSADWDDFGTDAAATGVIAIGVDVYENKDGFGYIVFGQVISASDTYRRSENIEGTDTNATHDWEIVEVI